MNVTANRTIYADENLTVIAELNNLTTGTVNITVSNENYTLTFNEIPVVNGTVKYNIAGLYAGDYNVTVTYNGDDIFYVKSNSTNVTVLKDNPKLKFQSKTMFTETSQRLLLKCLKTNRQCDSNHKQSDLH